VHKGGRKESGEEEREREKLAMKKGKQDNDLASDPIQDNRRKEIFENRILHFFFLSSFFFKHEREYGIFVYPALSHPPTVCRPNFFSQNSRKSTSLLPLSNGREIKNITRPGS